MKRLNSYFIGLILLQIIPLKTYALDFTITFTASGATNSVETVQVQNLTKGTTLIVPAGNVLNLYDGTITATVDINSSNKKITVYPNPVIEKTTVSFFAKQNGESQIQIFSIDGKMAVESTHNCQMGENNFQLSLPKGLFTIKIEGNGYSYATKVISQSTSTGKATVIFNGNVKKSVTTQNKIKSGVSSMLYNTNDRLLFTGVSGNYRTNIVDVPTESKMVNFNFVECKDGDNNYYTVVQIGSQLWTAENLKTTKYRNGESITNVTDKDLWGTTTSSAFCYVNNDVNLSAIYGCWYNFYAVNDSRNIAPIGWHVATNEEWANLISSLNSSKMAGAKLKESGNAHWLTDNQASTNEVGFTALPGGFRSSYPGFYTSTYGHDAYWWTATESPNGAIYRGLMLESTSDYTSIDMGKNYGMGVRLVHD